MTTLPSQQSPGGTIVLHIDRLPAVDPNTAEYSVSFRAMGAMGDILLGKVHGLDTLGGLLRKLNLTGPAVETACTAMIERSFHSIQGVNLTPQLIRNVGF
jgi:hypothetical protein